MARVTRFGLLTFQHQPWPALVDQWRVAAEMGFDHVWLPDHFAPSDSPSTPWFECWTALAALGACTKGVRLGAMVSSITLRSPAILARQALTVDHISAGRLELGIGGGGAPLDYAMTGNGPWLALERIERLEETVQIVDGLLRTGAATHRGSHYSIEGAVMRPAPVQQPRPPIILAAHGRRSLALTARMADGWNSLGYRASTGRFKAGQQVRLSDFVRETAEMSAELDELTAAAGRPPDAVRRTVTLLQHTRALSSVGAFEDVVGRYHAAGIDEFVVYRPGFLLEPAEAARQLAVMDRVAAELPRLRAQFVRPA